MRILYPLNPLNEREADEPYQDEFLKMKELGIECSLFDFDSLSFEFYPSPRIESGEVVLYRGWMLDKEKYKKLEQEVSQKGASMLTSSKDYMNAHHMINWYDILSDLTPMTVFSERAEVEEVLKDNTWGKYFVKDQVKSNSNEKGSIANSKEEISEILDLIEMYRGSIEGQVSLRMVEDFVEESEERYFIFNKEVYSNSEEYPEILNEINKRIGLPFYSVDLIKNTSGEVRLVEIGDGQVSDKKQWDLNNFVKIFS
jgi:hypothetical protein